MLVALQIPYNGSESMWWLSSILLDTRAIGMTTTEVQMKLSEAGVPTRRIFMPIVEFPPYLEKNQDKYAQAYQI